MPDTSPTTGTSRITGRTIARLLGNWYADRPSTRDLYEGVRRLVLEGTLNPGARLPAERELAEALGASRTLIASALARLRDDGFVVSHRGAGSWISVPGARAVSGPSGGWHPPDGTELINMAQATPAALPAIMEAFERAAARLPVHGAEHGYQPHGLVELRERIAERYTRRGVPTTPGQVLVTNGAQHAFALVLRMLTSPGQRVLVEHPTYPNALEAIRAVNATPVPVAMGDGGWDVELFEATLAQSSPRLAYLIPDFQNPTGVLMPDSQRARIATALRRNRTVGVVDETLADIDLRQESAPSPLASFEDRYVVTIGSASKSFWGGLRLGWIRAPEEFVQRLIPGRAAVDLGSPVLEQLALADVLDDEERILAQRRSESTARRDHLVAALRERCPQWTFRVPDGGLSLWCDLGAPVAGRIAVAAEQHRVRIAAGPRFAVRGSLDRYLRLPYTLPESRLSEAVSRLAAAANSVVPGEHGGEWEEPLT